MLEVELDNEEVFLERPLLLDDFWVEVVVPALATLFADATWECDCNLGPVLGSVEEDKLSEEVVFFFRPAGAHHVITISKFEESFVAFNFRLSEDFADAVPGLFSIVRDVLEQVFVL